MTKRKRLGLALLIPMFALLGACYGGGGAPPPANAVEVQIEAQFARFGPGVVNCMLRVADRESGDDPGARNPSGASGPFQIMLPLHNDLFYALGVPPDWWHWASPFWGVAVAVELYESSGIAPWGHC